MPNQNKQSKCTVCEKWMRSDKLQRHMKTHNDLLSLSEEELKEELRARHTIQLEREAKRQRIEEIAAEEGLSLPKEVTAEETIDKETVRKEMMEENQQYISKIELGRMLQL